MKVKTLTQTAILSTVALTIFVIEAQFPPIVIPGVKLGLSNIVTMIAMMFVSIPSAFCVTFIRITLGAFFCGSLTSFMFSMTGGLLAFFTMALFINKMDKNQIWVVSVLGALSHSIGQIIIAYFLINNSSVFTLLPLLTISSIATGVLTGLISQRLWFTSINNRTNKKK